MEVIEENSNREEEGYLTVSHLSLRNFRNYEALDFEMGPGFHVIAGPNAQGKTNFLEALHFLSSTKLLRGSKETEAIRMGSDRATVTGEIGSTAIALVLETGIRKRAFLNSLGLGRAADLIGRLPSVCVSAFDLEIVRGEPADRRMFLDMELSQSSAGYLRHFTGYRRALDQRNSLLRHAVEHYVAAESFEPWEVQLAHHGAAMRAMRREMIQELSSSVAEAHAYLGSGESLKIAYEPKDDAHSEEEMTQAYAKSRDTDIHRKGTTVGPHRDDLALLVDGKDARNFGSQGQQRSTVLSLKLATMEMQRRRLGQTPLLLLDDILSDLDSVRRANLTQWVVQHGHQAVLTCTEPEAIGASILAKASVYLVNAGRIQAA